MTVLHRLAADPAWVVDPDTPGSFAGYANRFNVTDSYGTRFLPGSWDAGGLDPDRVYPLLDMHQAVSARDVLGGFQAREDDAGLWIAGTFAETPPARPRGSWPGWDSPPSSPRGSCRLGGKDGNEPGDIEASRLVEVSLIIAGMASSPGAELALVRSHDEALKTDRDRRRRALARLRLG